MRQPKQQALAPLLSIKKLSQKSYNITSLIQQAENRQSLDDLINQCLPELLLGHFKANHIQENTLTLTGNSAKLMTRFRFIQDEVLAKLNSLISPQEVLSIQIKVRPSSQLKPTHPSSNSPLRRISKKNAQILLEEAEHTTDQNLKKILTSLAKKADS